MFYNAQEVAFHAKILCKQVTLKMTFRLVVVVLDTAPGNDIRKWYATVFDIQELLIRLWCITG